MRLKVLPGDFRVREVLDFARSKHGVYRVHLLQKEKLTTVEALDQVSRQAGVSREAIAHAGLKDRQAVTQQWISVKGREVDIHRPNLRVRLVGRSDQPITSKLSAGNHFTIVLRDLDPAAAATVRRNMPSLLATGFPNFFDDQRFGCLKHNQGFIMRQILRGDCEGALRQLLASPSEAAIAGDVKLKQILERRWGDWESCAQTARGHYGRIFRHLHQNPEDFRGALEMVPGRLRLIHAFAFQSYLWNLTISRMVWEKVPGTKRIVLPTLAGELCGWRYLDRRDLERLRVMDTPLYGPEGGGGAPVFRDVMRTVLQREGLRREDFLNHQVPGMILVEEPRTAVIVPEDLTASPLEGDEVHRGRRKMTLSFSLPRGAYATMLIKRLFAEPMFGRQTRPRRTGSRQTGSGRARPGPRRGGHAGAASNGS